MSEPTVSTLSQPTVNRSMSKRDFLFGAMGGAAVGIAAMTGSQSLLAQRKQPSAADEADPDIQTSYAQAGEDVVVSFIFAYLKLARPTYMDIGAADPVRWSNTYFFYKQGCRGILVEPNIDYVPKMKQVRPGDIVLNFGIGPENTTADYYRLTEPGWNTFDKADAEQAVKNSGGQHSIREVMKLPLVNINDALDQHYGGKTPDFVSIDVEGLDLTILKSINWNKHRPKVFCVETLSVGTNLERPEIGQYLAAHGYVARGSTFVNTIFVDKKWLG